MNKIEITVDVITGDIVTNEAPFTAQELAYSAQVTAQAEAEKTQVEAIKTSALDKLTALGLTQDEIKAILGITL
jgi:hypothetical protein